MVSPPQGTQIVTQVVVVTFLTLGFLASFLWTRIYYGPLQTLGDINLIARLNEIISDYKKRLVEKSVTAEKNKAATVALLAGKVATPKYETASSKAAAGAPSKAAPRAEPDVTEWPEDVWQRFQKFVAAPVIYDSDPAGQIFQNTPREASGRRLEAEILTDLNKALIITARVKGLGGEPLKDPVTFLLHPTLDDPVLCVRPQKDVAEVNFYAEGWITVVAVLDKGKTVLAYDLREMPKAPRWFKDN